MVDATTKQDTPKSKAYSFEAEAKAKDRTVEAKAKAKDTKFCPRGSSRPRPGLEDYITAKMFRTGRKLPIQLS